MPFKKRRNSDVSASASGRRASMTSTSSRNVALLKLFRRTAIVAVLTLLSWTAYKHRQAGLNTAYNPSTPLQTQASSISETSVSSSKPSSYPFAKGTFQLQEPSYQVLIMRSTIQHQDDTWKHVVTRNGNSWLLQSVAWLRVADGGLRPELTAVSGWCKNSPSSIPNAADPVSVKAEVKVLWTDYRDRGIDQDALLFVECDATSLLRQHYGLSDALPSDFSKSDIAAFSSVVYDFAFEHNLGEVETSTSGKVPLVQWYTAMNVEVEVSKPLPRTAMTACLSPAFYDKMPLLKWLEWREHMRRIGTDRVAWYGRQETMGRFVEEYNKLSGTQDVFRYAPPLGDQGPSFFTNPYHDQDAWYADCVLEHRQSSNFLLILDVDEYPMPNFDDPSSRSLSQQWLEFLESLPADRGMWEMTRIPMSAPAAQGKPSSEKMQQDQLQCVNGLDKKVKSFYRSKDVMVVNQHKKRHMYPIGADLAKQFKARPERPMWEMNWNSSIEDQWPKLMHYRWFNDPSENGCAAESPMASSPGYAKYLNDLREDVFEKKAKLEVLLGDLV